jgi:anti-anti-sigma factor
MPIQVVRDGPVATIELDGLIETRAAQQFEKEAAALLGGNVLAVVVDFTRVALITSAGIRVLFMMAQRLHRGGGGLALCCLSDRVRGVFEVAKLLQQFRVTATRQEAIAQLSALVQTRAPAPPPASRLTRLVATALSEHGPEPVPPPGGRRSRLSATVERALKRDG